VSKTSEIPQPEQPSWIAGRYEGRGILGYGGLSNVYRVWDHHLKRMVALKRMKVDPELGREKVLEDSLREAMMTASLHHPNIVTVFDYGVDDETAFIVMEMIEGENLEQCLERGPLHMQDFHILARQSLDAVKAAHEAGMMHRDLKPANFMLQRGVDGSFTIKILDFGLAKYLKIPQPQSVDHFNSVMGSIHYMAPEQLKRQPIDFRTDLYSLGCIFYEALTGHVAFDGNTVTELIDAHVKAAPYPLPMLRPEVSAMLEAWVCRFMERDPARRHQSAGDALQCLPTLEDCTKREDRKTIRLLVEKFLAPRKTASLPPGPANPS
jgi:serine/threonine protein kinase